MDFFRFVVGTNIIRHPYNRALSLPHTSVPCSPFPMFLVWLRRYIRVKFPKKAIIVEKVGNVMGAVFLVVAVILGVLDAPELIGNPDIYWRSWILGEL